MESKSTTQKIQELFELFQSGALSKEEFDSLKSELLGQAGTSTDKGNDSSNSNDLHIAVPNSINSLPVELKNTEQFFENSNQSEINLTKKKKKSFFLISSLVIIVTVIAVLFLVQKKSTVTDIDGNIYRIAKIGSQIWMVENLNVSTFQNGEPIPEAKSDKEWEQARIDHRPAWCYYDNNPDNGKKNGKLYNWYAVTDPRGLAPKGWHMTSSTEWRSLISFLGGEKAAIAKLKSIGNWEINDGNNSSGFNALPSGYRVNAHHDQHFDGLNYFSEWWTQDNYNESMGIVVSGLVGFTLQNNNKGCGLPVRCLKNN